jgi:hypothetical protein
MLVALLGSIQTALASFVRGFLVVALIPTFYLVGVNVALLQAMGWLEASRVKQFISIEDTSHVLLAMAILSSAAFVVGLLQPWLLSLLEGDHLPGWMQRLLQQRQTDRLDTLRAEAERHFREEQKLTELRDQWVGAGSAALPNGATIPQSVAFVVAEIAGKRRRGELIDSSEIGAALEKLQSRVGPASTMPAERARKTMHRVLDYARDRRRHRYYQVQNRMQFTYPGDVLDPQPSSDNVLAATAFGNIGRTMRSYSLRRYHLDLDIFWSRIQKVIADDSSSKYFDTLQTQKTHVDFAVTLFWFTVATGVIWIPILAMERQHPRLFRAVALGAPFLSWALYHLACQAYLVFADHVRTGVDLFRLKVLEGYRLNGPAGTVEERIVWERLGNLVGYGDDDARFTYVRDEQQ